jgi:UDP-galactopyranose mutase
MKPYAVLPSYMAHADVGIMPFAINEATRFISPTKTPEYLSAGLPVVSTPILDVVQPYGNLGLVHVADDAAGFVAACEAALRLRPSRRVVEAVLAKASWEAVWEGMVSLIDGVRCAGVADNSEPVSEAAGAR